MPYFEYEDVGGAVNQHINLYYEVHGQGRPLLFLHGRGGNVLSWWQQVPVFVEHYQCIVIEQRGWGRSSGALDGPWGDVFARDVHMFIDHLKLDAFAVIAQSMGGWTLSALSERLEQRGQSERLVAAVMSGTVGGYVPSQLEAIYDQHRQAAYTQRAAWQQGNSHHPALAATTPGGLQTLYSMIARLNRPPPVISGAPDTLARRDCLSLPEQVLFIAGEQDMFCPPEVLRGVVEGVPKARLELLPNIGHSPYFEAASDFNTIVDKFLAEVYV
ncbi:MAG: alpha/beta hydrolase [Deinococcota bacterium]